MSRQPPNSLEEVRIHGEIGDDPDELAAVADAVVRGCSICYARITSLRKLIEAVQEHPDAKLAPPHEERGEGWTPPRGWSPDALTELEICAGEIADDGGYRSLDVRFKLVVRTHFAGDASFDRAQFAGGAWFIETRFAAEAAFEETRFAGYAGFHESHFDGAARFNKALFNGTASFGHTHFAGITHFSGAQFAGDASIFRAHFIHNAWFGRTRFSGDVSFDLTHFANHAGFPNAQFGRDVWFRKTRFAGSVGGDLRPCYLRRALFGEQARRAQRTRRTVRERERRKEDAVGSDKPKTWRARGAAIGDWLFDLGIRLENSRWTKWLVRIPKALLVTAPGRMWRWITREFGWRTVRALGQLQILNRVSVVALIAVPVLAALTGALQVQFPQWPGLGTSPALLFFAAVFVTLGLLAYQVWSAEDVRKYDEDEFIDRAHRRYPEEATDRDDGLRRSIENLEEIAKRRPDRHKNLVAHHGDTIWIPPRDEIGWFEDWTPPPDPPDPPDPPVSQDDTAEDAGGESVRDDRPTSREPVERADRALPEKAQRGIVPGAERRRITIEEGAKAEYWLKSREQWPLAWVSFTLYLVGVLCLLDVLRRQAINVAEAAGWTSWPFG